MLPALVLAAQAAAAGAQEWSGASLRGAGPLRVPAGFTVETVATGFRLPQGLALDPPDGLWVLTQWEPGGGAGALVRVPLDGRGPVDAARLPWTPLPYGPGPARFRPGSLARHPATGDLYVAEASGRHLLRVRPGGPAVLFARGAHALADQQALGFDAAGRLLVLDFEGRPQVADAGPEDPLADLQGDEPVQGPVVYGLAVDEPWPLPRDLAHARRLFPPGARPGPEARLPRYGALLPRGPGEMVLVGPGGSLDRVSAGRLPAPLARLPGVTALAEGPGGALLGLDHLGGRIVRRGPDGTVTGLVEGLARPTALAVHADGSLLVAGDSGRLLRLRPSPPGPSAPAGRPAP